MRTLFIAAVSTLFGATVASAGEAPTFYKDVLPVLQAHCQNCHRPGEVAPMALLTYEQSRPWALGIKKATQSKAMPPWFAEPGIQHYANEKEKVLSAEELDTLARWADAGAPAGDPAAAPPARVFPTGWNITPDVVVEMPKPFELPARGTINYKYVLVKTNFPEDMWVVAAEMRPGDPAVLHHGKVWVRPPGSKWMEKAEPGEAYETETQRDILGRNSVEEGNDILGKFNPGLGPQRFDRQGAAKFIPKGSDIVFELHYTTSGKPTTDVSKLGLVLTKTPPDTRYYFHAGPTALNLAIPPNEAKAEVVSELTLGENARLVYMQPHMHLRGKDFEFRVVLPEGASKTVLKGRFDFEWQMGYELAEPIDLPKGSKLQLITHFDNSKGNRFNPNPEERVLWGPQNWDEMSNCFIGVLFDRSTAPEKVFLRSGPSLMPRAEFGPTLDAFNRVPKDAVAPASNASTGGRDGQ
ncbi:MAG TPA: hypothetical protein VGQ37_06745 [Vicinamibacterales bacterium]|jgi:hypothetical protein|nr:hypothetical protein [Vicinamibacterales bacterium]